MSVDEVLFLVCADDVFYVVCASCACVGLFRMIF